MHKKLNKNKYFLKIVASTILPLKEGSYCFKFQLFPTIWLFQGKFTKTLRDFVEFFLLIKKRLNHIHFLISFLLKQKKKIILRKKPKFLFTLASGNASCISPQKTQAGTSIIPSTSSNFFSEIFNWSASIKNLPPLVSKINIVYYQCS